MNDQATKSRKRHLSWHFSIFAHLYLASTMGALTVVLLPREADGADVGSLFFIGWMALYGTSMVYMLIEGIRIFRGDILVICFVVFVVITTLWSVQPDRTLIYGGILALNALFCFLVRENYDLDKFLKICLQTILILCVLSVVCKTFNLELVRYIDVHGRPTFLGTEPIRGFFNHKITAGIYSAMALALGFSLYRGAIRFLVCCFLFVFILMTGSSAALAISGIVFLIYFLTGYISVQNFSFWAYVMLLLFIALFVGLAVTNLHSEILELLGRDETLTGRSLLWEWGLDVGLQRPFLGWGYMGYFGTPQADAVARNIAEFRTYDVPHFHNSFIQMFVDSGVVGLLLGIAVPIVTVARLYSAFLRMHKQSFITAISTILALIVAGLGVHVFYKYNDFAATYVICIFLITTRHKTMVKNAAFGLTKGEAAF